VSSEVLESLIGKGKRLQGQHSRGGFTRLILGMAASVVQITQDRVCEALEAVRHAHLIAWTTETLGTSLAAQRLRAHRPGWLVLWRGWTKLQTMLAGYQVTPRARSG
jgi:hypothetical protein